MTDLETLDKIIDVLESTPVPVNQLQHNVRYEMAKAVKTDADAVSGVAAVVLTYQDWMRRTAHVCDDPTEMLLANIGMALEAGGR